MRSGSAGLRRIRPPHPKEGEGRKGSGDTAKQPRKEGPTRAPGQKKTETNPREAPKPSRPGDIYVPRWRQVPEHKGPRGPLAPIPELQPELKVIPGKREAQEAPSSQQHPHLAGVGSARCLDPEEAAG